MLKKLLILKKPLIYIVKKNKTIHSVFKEKFINSFLKKAYIFFKIAQILKKRKGIILTRSLISSFAMTIFNIDHFLEIHQEIKGLTKILLINLNFINSKKYY